MAKRSVTDDPVVAEVRRIRAELWQEAGGTVAGLIELVRRESADKRRRPARRKRASTRK